MKLLIIDDSKVMRAIVKKTLRQAGFGEAEILEAANGAEGLSAVQEHQPDFVLSDWNMPEKTGIELLTDLRAMGNNTPFGFVTSESADDMKSRAMGAGALFLITKPFTPEDFEKALRPHLAA